MRTKRGHLGALEEYEQGSLYMNLIELLSAQRPVSRKSRDLFGPEKPVVKPESAWFEKLIF